METDSREILQYLASQLVDQEAASVLVPPQVHAEGYWFGGGNVVMDAEGARF